MGNFVQSVERKAFGVAIDGTLKHINKDREKGLFQIMYLRKKFIGDNFSQSAYEGAKKLITDPDSKWMH